MGAKRYSFRTGGTVIPHVAAAAFATLLLLFAPFPAAANFGSTRPYDHTPGEGCVSLANNKWHAVRFYSVTADVRSGVSWGIIEYDSTDLVVYSTTSDPLPDVRVYDWYYGTQVAAWVDCPHDNTGTGSYGQNLDWCRGLTLKVDLGMTDNYNFTATNWRHVGCHELGHTVGLRHRSSTSTCMSQCLFPPPPYLSSCWNRTDLGSHEINDHINPFY